MNFSNIIPFPPPPTFQKLSTPLILCLEVSWLNQQCCMRSATSCIAEIASPEMSGLSSSWGFTAAASLASLMSLTLFKLAILFAAFHDAMKHFVWSLDKRQLNCFFCCFIILGSFVSNGTENSNTFPSHKFVKEVVSLNLFLAILWSLYS